MMEGNSQAAVSSLATAIEHQLHLDPLTQEMVSKSELKRRLKQREKEASRASKLATTQDTKDETTDSEEEETWILINTMRGGLGR